MTRSFDTLDSARETGLCQNYKRDFLLVIQLEDDYFAIYHSSAVRHLLDYLFSVMSTEKCFVGKSGEGPAGCDGAGNVLRES